MSTKHNEYRQAAALLIRRTSWSYPECLRCVQELSPSEIEALILLRGAKHKPIRSPKQHQQVPEEIRKLWNVAKPGTPEGWRFEHLSKLVEDYEREKTPIPK